LERKFHEGYVLNIKEIAFIINASLQTARKNIKAWKSQLGLDAKAFFTVHHLGKVMLLPPYSIIESLKMYYS
jgi:hypothetical protein